MIQIHKASDRGRGDYGWLKASYSFSFAEYFNPQRLGFRSLRVLNEDRIAGGGAFPSHGHRDMEILTYIIDGTLEHVDSMGNREVIEAGEFQMMTAGKGVVHSEANASQAEPLHLFQIWIEPNETGLSPGYEQVRPAEVHNELRSVVAPVDAPGRTAPQEVMSIHQDVRIYSGQLDGGSQLGYAMEPSRGAWLQVAKGALEVNGQRLDPGDGCQVQDEGDLQLVGVTDCEFLLLDLA